ncbi:transcriptional antiterminator RfaH [Sulfuritortus calidifontis]|uniref:Transcription antitermination protein RfaH n=1 Tax=Sulfuritortus calidifontis TaxID=1914471 RepID=A0A4R3JTT7_9PROT|nr:transcription/translation regulatory transformer protein RfaH [Sulfuritortus calidifontis]TCS70997.1 transcriptional antiterminator RfaH [Sulfuritortus calidifontis]
MHWYLIHTKPRQEHCALQNLEQQGYECYLPLIAVEKLRQGRLAMVEEPLFPRYLFIRLEEGASGKGWGPIRSTRGVSRLVSFGNEPARLDDRLVEQIRTHEGRRQPQPLFTPGERVRVTQGPFAGLEAIYQMREGENRVMVLIELLSKPVRLGLAPASLRKVG